MKETVSFVSFNVSISEKALTRRAVHALTSEGTPSQKENTVINKPCKKTQFMSLIG